MPGWRVTVPRVRRAPSRPLMRLDGPLLLAQDKCLQLRRCQCERRCLPPAAVIVGVSDGEIIVSNSSGAPVSYRAGQWAQLVQNFNSRPLTLPGDPGLPIYQPPATFFQNISAGGVRNSSSQCIVS